jgi:hypothetical protein
MNTIGATNNNSIRDRYSDDLIKKIKIYGVSWQLRTRLPMTIENLKRHSAYCLTLKGAECSMDELFDDYKSCKELLTSQDTFFSSKNACVACVRIYFAFRKITIYFRPNGDYYFNGIWYKANYELYFYIFLYFGKDAMMPDEIIEKGKEIIYQKEKILYGED